MLVTFLSVYSGRNYDFRCINIVFWRVLPSQRVQRLRDELTLAQIREKLPNGWTVWHTCANSSGNGYTSNKLPLESKGGHSGFFKGSNIQKSREAVKRLDRLALTLVHRAADLSGNGHSLNTSHPSIPKGHFGGFRASRLKKPGERRIAR